MNQLTIQKIYEQEERLSREEREKMNAALYSFSCLIYPVGQSMGDLAIAEKYLKLGYLLAYVAKE